MHTTAELIIGEL